MISTSVVYLCLTLIYPVISSSKYDGSNTFSQTDYPHCGDRKVYAMRDFDYDKFAKDHQWDYYSSPSDLFETRKVISASLYVNKSATDENLYYLKISVTLRYGNIYTAHAQERYLGNGTSIKTYVDAKGNKLDQTNFRVSFYGFQEKAYLQYYVCSENGVKGANDVTFALVYPGKILNQTELDEMRKRDRIYNFTEPIVRLARTSLTASLFRRSRVGLV